MWIYLLRHGIAEDPSHDRSDEQRELTAKGVERLQRCANAWQRLVETPDVVICSPLIRARQTAELFAEAVSFDGDLREERRVVPSSHPNDAIALLEGELLGGTNAVAIVGHEPHLGYLLGSLLSGHPHLSVPLKKGMLIALETESTTSLVCGLRFSLTQKAAARLQ